MLVLLFTTLVLICFISYILFRDILSPTFLSSAMFGLSSFISLLNYSNWGVQYDIKIFILIIGSMISLLIGEIIGRRVVISKKTNKDFILDRRRIDISAIKNIIITLLGVIFIVLSIKNTLGLANYAGYSGGDQILKYARWGSHSEETDQANFFTIYRYLMVGIGYLYLYILIFNKVFAGGWNRKDLKYLPIIFIFIFEVVLSTSRADIILIIQMIIFMYVIAWRIKNNWKVYSLGKFLAWGTVAILMFFVIFQYLGTLTGKTGLNSTWETLSIYAGSPIAALEEWLKSSLSGNRTWGKETFWGVISLFNRFGADIETISLTKEFITFSNDNPTNIYTSIRHYYQDFGAIGLFIIYLVKGVFLTKFYMIVKRNNKFDITVILYSYFAYDLVRQITAAEFLSMYFTIAHMFTIIGIIVASIIILPKNIYRVQK